MEGQAWGLLGQLRTEWKTGGRRTCALEHQVKCPLPLAWPVFHEILLHQTHTLPNSHLTCLPWEPRYICGHQLRALGMLQLLPQFCQREAIRTCIVKDAEVGAGEDVFGAREHEDLIVEGGGTDGVLRVLAFLFGRVAAVEGRDVAFGHGFGCGSSASGRHCGQSAQD